MEDVRDMLEEGLLRILEKVYEEGGFDFRQYKESSIRRRIERRMRARKVFSYQEYVKLLDRDPGEYKKLLDTLTIKVTEFFRDPEAWQILHERVLSEIIRQKIEKRKENKDDKSVLRIWSAGCATGEEAYSVALLLEQLLGEREDDFEVNIWGTDMDKESLLKAQQAEYKSSVVKNVPQDILAKYFSFNGNFRVKSLVANKVQFKFHDLVLDEPSSEMDVVLCRNVAIYFGRPLQEKIYMDFYNSLNEKGYLFLGKAETLIGPAQERFRVIDKRWRIYQKGWLNEKWVM